MTSELESAISSILEEREVSQRKKQEQERKEKAKKEKRLAFCGYVKSIAESYGNRTEYIVPHKRPYESNPTRLVTPKVNIGSEDKPIIAKIYEDLIYQEANLMGQWPRTDGFAVEINGKKVVHTKLDGEVKNWKEKNATDDQIDLVTSMILPPIATKLLESKPQSISISEALRRSGRHVPLKPM